MSDNSLTFDIAFGGVDNESVKKAWAKSEKDVQAQINAASKLKIKIDDANVISLNKKLEGTKKLLSDIANLQSKTTVAKPLTSYQAGKLQVLSAEKMIVAQQRQQTELARTIYWEDKNAAAKNRAAAAQDKATVNINKANTAWRTQSGILNGIPQYLNAYVSILGATRLVTNIREVTAEFELQRVALGAIIQDKAKSDELFAKITQLAVQSPFQVKELITYTKELSAYRIETENLFDTTKRLADISAGLGVDMGRLILAYGQVKAASVLRGQELRQFTEAGIPLVQLLADKFSQLRGEMVSTGEVFQLISDRAVSFSMIKEIFEDMTNAGGTFYNMQKIQAETLAGSWSNMRDEIDLAFNAMGQQNYGALKGITEIVKELARNWESIVNVLESGAVAFGIYKASTISATLATKALVFEEARLKAIQDIKFIQSPKLISLIIGQNYANLLAVKIDNLRIATQTKLNASTNILTKTFYKLYAVILANPYVFAAAAIAGLVTWIITAKSEATKMSEALDKAHSSVAKNTDDLTSKLKDYSNKLNQAAQGSEEYRNIMSELVNEYGKYIPKQLLDAENLTLLADKTDLLTAAILRKKKAEAIKAGETATEEMYGGKLTTETSNIIKELELSFDPIVAAKIAKEYMDAVRQQLEKGESIDENKTLAGVIAQQFDISIDDAIKKVDELGRKSLAAISGFSGAVRFWGNLFSKGKLNLSPLLENLEDAKDITSDYVKMLVLNTKKADELYSGLTVSQKAIFDERKNQLNDLSKAEEQALENNKKISYKSKIEEEQSRLDIQQKYAKKRMDLASKEIVDTQAQITSELSKPKPDETLLNNLKNKLIEVQTIYGLMAEEAKLTYEKIKPTELNKGIVLLLNNLAKAKKVSADTFSQLIKGADEDTDAYGSRIKSLYDSIFNKIAQLEKAKLQTGALPNEEDLIKQKTLLEGIVLVLDNIGLETKSQAKTTKDIAKERADQLKTEIGIIKEAYNKYRELEDQIGSQKAQQKITDLYKDVFDDFKQLKGISPIFDDSAFRSALEKALKEGENILDKSDKLKLKTDISDEELKSVKDKLKKSLSQLQSEIEGQQKANKFFESILGITGDEKLAADITIGIYGSGFEDTAGQIKEQLTRAFEGIDISLELGGDVIDYAGLLKKIKELETKLGTERAELARKEVEQLRDSQAQKQVELMKSLGMYEDYESKRNVIIRNAERERMEILKTIPAPKQEVAIQASKKKEKTALATLDFETLKQSDEWIKAFEDLDRLSTRSINNILAKFQEFKDGQQDLNPTEIKALTDATKKLREESEKRGSFNSIIEGFKEWKASAQDVKKYTDELTIAEQELDIATQNKNKAEAAFRDKGGNVITKGNAYADAIKKEEAAKKKLSKANQNLKTSDDAAAMARAKTLTGLNAISQAFSGMASLLSEVTELLGLAEDSEIGAFLQDMAGALSTVATILLAVAAAIILVNTVATPLLIAAAAIAAVLAAISFFTGRKSREANKEIERQELIIKELKNAYDDLERSIEKTLGAERYLRSGELINNLYKQQIALIKQANAEASKGKKRDAERESDLRREAQLIDQEIEDILTELKDEILGGTARDFAQELGNALFDALADGKNAAISAWDEATDNIISNLVRKMLITKLLEEPLQRLVDDFVKSAVPDTTALQKEKARVETSLQDTLGMGLVNWEGEIMEFSKAEKLREEKLAKINKEIKDAETKGLNITGENVGKLDQGVKDLGEEFYGWLEQFPDLMKYITGSKETGLTGIAKNIAQASEDQITGLAAGINTQNGYFAQTVTLTTNIYLLMQKWDAERLNNNPDITLQGLIGIQQTSLAHLRGIEQNTKNTSDGIWALNEKIDAVIKPRGATATKVFKVELS